MKNTLINTLVITMAMTALLTIVSALFSGGTQETMAHGIAVQDDSLATGH